MTRTCEVIKLSGGVTLSLLLSMCSGDLRASEQLSQVQLPRCSAVADMIQSGHITLARGLGINCNPVSEYCEITGGCGVGGPAVMPYKRYCSRTSDVPCSGGRVIY